MTKALDDLLKNNGFQKINKKAGPFYAQLYTHYIYLENLDVLWYVKIEKPTRACKFYSLYTKFSNNYTLIKSMLDINEHSGKCNRFYSHIDEVGLFIINVQLLDKNYEKDGTK